MIAFLGVNVILVWFDKQTMTLLFVKLLDIINVQIRNYHQ